MRVDIWSDVVCPWCYVGKARFFKALADFGHRDEVEVVFRSFELDPGRSADEHETVLAMLASKYGMPEAQARQAEGRVAGLARAEGLGYREDRPVGNTFDIHRVLQRALAGGVQLELTDAVDRAYFADAKKIFDREVLTGIAVEAGLGADDVAKVLDTDACADAVRQDEAQARELGISGVPFFAFDMALGVSGAQGTETFASALSQAWDRRG